MSALAPESPHVAPDEPQPAARSTRCICPSCIGRTVQSARKHLARGNPNLAAEIMEFLARDLPGGVVPCLADEDPFARLAELYAQVREWRGWARAYAAEEQQRLALGDKCPCLAVARQ